MYYSALELQCCGIRGSRSGVEGFYAELAAPGSLWRFLDRWLEAVHMITAIAVVTEEQLENKIALRILSAGSNVQQDQWRACNGLIDQ